MSGHNHTPEVHEHVDAWHHHGADEGLPQAEHLGNLNVTAIFRWGAAISVIFVLVLVVTAMYFSRYTNRLRLERQERAAWNGLSAEARGLRDSAEATLSTGGKPETYAWASEQQGAVQLPIEQAMRKVAQTYREGK
ncbi:MAG: hypothetical protein SFY69_06495 [Planctomycetota bacterium]|nr:hypothetical protein [Planctomycetota bacterium]